MKLGISFRGGLLYESYIKDSLDVGGFARKYRFTEYSDTNSANWVKTDDNLSEYTISPNRVISIGNYSTTEDGNADIGGMSGVGSGTLITQDPNGANGIHLNVELKLLYTKNDDGKYQRYYKDNYAISRDITDRQLTKMLSRCNSVDHYNVITNNCTEIASKAWNTAFDENLHYRIITTTPTPRALKNTLKNMTGSFIIDFHSERWKNYINREVENI